MIGHQFGHLPQGVDIGFAQIGHRNDHVATPDAYAISLCIRIRYTRVPASLSQTRSFNTGWLTKPHHTPYRRVASHRNASLQDCWSNALTVLDRFMPQPQTSLRPKNVAQFTEYTPVSLDVVIF
ncbi:hypothetical protein GCM10010872_41190 [Dyella flava]|nr:hypothetical protein GCM10010872_41190 [Dyella flava]